MTLTLATVEDALRAEGLTPRGAFHLDTADNIPPLPDGKAAGTVVMAGNVGPAMWAAFSKSDWQTRNPLDDWSHRVLGALAERFAGAAVFPNDGPPYIPFQRWGRRAEALHHSPLGILIHPDHGLWHGYRGALLLPGRLDLPAPDTRPSPCDSCADRPCLSTCPVGAFTGGGYDVPACVGHMTAPAGEDCRQTGCRARRACPVGRDYIYDPAQANFHMEAFIAAYGPPG